jgi:hypothetical protein
MNCTISFYTGGRSWWVTKTFKDRSHVDNFIAYIKRTKGYNLDELYINDETRLTNMDGTTESFQGEY